MTGFNPDFGNVCIAGAAVRAQHSQLAGGYGGEFGTFHCQLDQAVQIEPSLRQPSPKNGNNSEYGRRLSAISPLNPLNRESGEHLRNRKSPPMAGILRLLGGVSPGARLPGWRRSADRTSLQANSLVSGNFTGNFAILGLRDTI